MIGMRISPLMNLSPHKDLTFFIAVRFYRINRDEGKLWRFSDIVAFGEDKSGQVFLARAENHFALVHGFGISYLDLGRDCELIFGHDMDDHLLARGSLHDKPCFIIDTGTRDVTEFFEESVHLRIGKTGGEHN